MNFNVSAGASGPINASASVVWQDTNTTPNAYGPLSASATTTIHRRVPTLTSTAASTPSTLIPGATATVTVAATNTGDGDALTPAVVVTNPDNSTRNATSPTILAGANGTLSTTWISPAIPVKQGGESDGAYQTRLTALDNAPLSFSTSLTWKDAANVSYGPVTAAASITRILPILTIAAAGPANAISGNAITYTVTVQNIGHTTATPSLSVTLPDSSVVTPALSPSGPLAPNATASATVNYTIPIAVSGTLTATASVSWKDSNNNNYGPQSAAVPTTATVPLAVTVNAGPNQSVFTPQNLQLQGTASGTPASAPVKTTWSQVSGPPTATFTNPASPVSALHLSDPGTYVLQLSATATVGSLTATQTSQVTITATAGTSTAPAVNAGPNQTIILPATTVTLHGAVSDPNGPFTVSWTQVSGPASATFSSSTTAVTQVTLSATGIYLLKLTATDSQFTSSSIVTVTLKPSAADPPPIVNAGPNQNVLMPSAPNNLPLGPHLQTVSTFSNAAQAMTYHQPTNRVLVSVNYGTNSNAGKPFNFELLAPDGTTSPFTTISGLSDEVYTIAARDEGGGKSIGGFPAGTTFTGNGIAGQITRISPDGSSFINPWVRLPNETHLLRGQLTIDRTGVWKGDLIVLASDATNGTSGVWRVGADGNPNAGVPTLLATLNTGGSAEGLVAVPNDVVRYGPWAGKIVVGGESSTTIFAIDTSSNVTSYNLGIGGLEFFELVVPNENFYAVDFGANKFLSIPAAELVPLAGDFLVGAEVNSFGVNNLYDVHWSSATNSFQVTAVGTGVQFEGGTMAPMALEGIAGVTSTTTLNGTVTDAAPIGPLTYAWNKISGPGTATFTNPSGVVTSPTSPATIVSFGLPGTYVLQLTGSDSIVSATSQTTVTIQGNAPPAVNAGPEQQGLPGSPVTLPGIVTDDGLPSGGQLNVFWTKVLGPGTVSFGSSKSTWDSAGDFTAALNSSGNGTAPNPNGPWSYGWEATRGGTFNSYTQQGISSGMTTFFKSAVGTAPQLYFNPAPVPVKLSGSVTISALSVALNPDTSGNSSVLRWTAPSAGAYLVQGFFNPADSALNPVWITWNTANSASTLFNATLGVRDADGFAYPTEAPFTFVQQLNAGDTLDFAAGSNGSSSQTNVAVTITAAGPAMTTATFGQGGDYILRLIGFDGQLYGYSDLRAAVVASCDAPPSGIVGSWPGDSSTTDIVNGNNGTAVGSLGYAGGKVGQAFNLDGLSAGVNVPQSSALNVGSMTLEAWVFPSSVAGEQPIIEWHSSSSLGVLFEIGEAFSGQFFVGNPGGLYVDFRNGGNIGPVSTPGNVVFANQWNHVAMTYDRPSGNVTLYVNGISYGSGRYTGTVVTNLPVQIGYGSTDGNGTVFFKGMIDEPAIYNRALSAAEILAIYSAGASGKCKGIQPLTVSAGANQFLILPNNSLSLNGSVSAPAGQTPTIAWSEVSGPGITFGTPNLALTTATVSAPGTYVLRLTAADSNATSTNDVTVTVYPIGTPQPTPPTVTAGSGQSTLQLGNPPSTVSTTLTGSVTATTGTPTVGWSEVSGPAAVTFGSLNQAVTTVQFSVAGTYVLQLSAAVPGAGQGNAVVTITVLAPPLQPPVVSPGVNTSVQLPNTTVTLNGSARDLGGNPLTLAWTQLSGPATVAFATPTQAVTQATLSTAGTYLLQLSASNAQYTSVSTVQVIVVQQGATNTAPVVTAGTNQTVTLPSITTTLNGTVTDDGLPVGVPLTITWAVVSGPGPVTFANAHSPVTQATFSANGAYVLQLTASDTQFSTTAQTTVTLQEPVNQAPVVTVPSAFTVQLPNGTATLNATATDDGLPLGSALRVTWTASPATVTFANLNAAVTTATFTAAGSYTLTLTATDSALTTIKTVAVTVLPAPTPPTVSIALPEGTEITQPTAVKATISNGTWTLQYALYNSASLTQTYTTLASGSGAVSNAIIATFDPTLLLNGTYQIQLSATDSVGQITTASTTVTVSRNMKIGVFSLAFNDLTVPVPGLPLTITRSYDSRDKGVGDFGVGWRLNIANVRLQKNRSLSPNWFEDLEYSAFTPTYCLSSTNSKIVTVVFPNNTVYKFQAQVSPQCQQIVSITNPTLSFTELPGAAGTAGATLAPLDGGNAIIDGSVPGIVNLIGLDGNTYDPTQFRLTLASGVQYVIDQTLGVTSVTDTNGNTLTINANGITSSAGLNVPFVRDTQGRITKITDPNGNPIIYGYTGADLTSFQDRTGAITTFAYAPGDYLQTITTPNNVQVLNNAYDPSGRLLSTADAFNKSIGYTHDIPHHTETVTDRLGNATTFVYDADGNITNTTDALGHVTSSTYDASDQKLTDTNALGKTSYIAYDSLGNMVMQTDSLGNITSYTYNNLQKPLTITDPLRHVTTNTYDTHGNLTSTKDAAGNTTNYGPYDTHGQLLQTTDALNNTTSFFYDQFGHLATQTDALGNVTTSTYDVNGNRLSQSVTRTFQNAPQTLLTQFTYDNQNRLTQTIFPENSSTQTHYNSLGQVDVRTDELGHQTQYQYDNDGRLTTTTYADSTTDTTVYDLEGRRTQTTNRGIVTQFVYDNAGRLTQTIAAPGAPNAATTTTNYDAAGQVTSAIDALGHATNYTYDDAGRRTQVTNNLSQITLFAYDAAGNQLTVKDARGNVITNSYDSDNRLIKVTYPDTKLDGSAAQFDSTAYDPLGRVQSRTDANGNTTSYGYDALGRLTSVTDALNQTTSYAYDEVGSRITQTDANLHATTYQYDQRGRRVGRSLPLNQPESYTYDFGGNLKTRTDFNGKTTTYSYDSLNRLLTKTPDASFGAAPISFTYTPTGKRNTMTDPSGTTQYGYDNRDRLTSKATPEGPLTYNYDDANNLTVLSAAGLSVTYTYDVLNRLSTVGESNTGSTSYAYDAAGNLSSFTTENGVAHAYTYDPRNRLTNLAVGTMAPPLASYAYTLDNAGHRTNVTELNGRAVAYSYDNIYRLTSETVSGIPGAGAVSYTYDAVGNRKQTASTLGTINPGLFNYDANDRLSTDTYDSNGNTTTSIGVVSAYDFENHLTGFGPNITMLYDGDGNRVSKTVNRVTTTYLVDDLNPTGYAQVVLETTGGETRQYVYGSERLSQRRVTSATAETRYFGYDGHGSVRLLTDSNGAVTDTYDYDAFGNLINSTGLTPNEFRFSGEQFDFDLNLYYNRARYYNTTTGRFWNMDTEEGDSQDPSSLHKYLYGGADPINHIDPTGNDFDLGSFAAATAVYGTIGAVSGIAINGVTNYIQGRPLFRGAGGAAAFGAAAVPLSVAFPIVGLVLAGLGIAGSGALAWNTFAGNASAGQKAASIFLVGLSIFGGRAASSNATGGSLWVNVEYGLGGLLSPNTGRMSAALESIRNRVWDFGEVLATRPAQEQNGLTLAVGVAEDSGGNLHTLIGTSERRGYIRPRFGKMLQPGDIVVKGGKTHAEADIVNYTIQQGWTLIGVGATRDICPACAADIESTGASCATPKK